MAKKVNSVFNAELTKNVEKGGSWLVKVTVSDEGIDTPNVVAYSAWSNASACKRWVKAKVAELTPRKSVKLTAGSALDVKGKPISWGGQLAFKREI